MFMQIHKLTFCHNCFLILYVCVCIRITKAHFGTCVQTYIPIFFSEVLGVNSRAHASLSLNTAGIFYYIENDVQLSESRKLTLIP